MLQNSQNFFAPQNFRFIVQRMPTVEFNIQRIKLPNITLSEAEQPTPFITIPQPGDHLIREDLEVTFKLDETMQGWIEIASWLFALGKPERFQQYAALSSLGPNDPTGLKSPILVQALNSAQQPNIDFMFDTAWPTFLSLPELDTTIEADVPYPTCTATFKYVNWDFKIYPQL